MAVEYKHRTGIDGLEMSPLQLAFAMRVMEDQDRLKRLEMARAVATAMSGEKEAWDTL